MLLAREPVAADAVMEAKSEEAGRAPLLAVYDAVIGPIIAFFRAHGWASAALMLGMITLYHLCDYMRGPMGNPYYSALSIDKDTIGWTRLVVGTPGSFLGIALGGFASLRIGNRRTLIVGAIIQPIAIGAFALLGFHGGDFSLLRAGPFDITAFQTIMAFDSVAIGFSGVALVAYMSTLTSLGYTATQYALLTSALAWTGKFLKGFSGSIVDFLQHGRTLLEAFALFYLVAAAIGAPAILLCIVLARRTPRPGRRADLALQAHHGRHPQVPAQVVGGAAVVVGGDRLAAALRRRPWRRRRPGSGAGTPASWCRAARAGAPRPR